MGLHYMCAVLLIGLIPTAKCTDIKTKTNGAAVFYLPPFSQCGSYSLVNPNNHNVLTVFDGHLQINGEIYGTRAIHDILVNGTIRFAIHLVTESDAGTYVLRPDDGSRCPTYFYSLTLTDAPARWLEWGQWSACTITCGMNGVKNRNRDCSKEGQCQGQSRQPERCRLEPCINARWSTWAMWSSCSKSCGKGTRQRQRECSNPNIDCGGKNEETLICSDRECPEAAWTDWTRWTVCSKTCGDGTTLRTRQCKTGLEVSRFACIGSNSEAVPCKRAPCFQTEPTHNRQTYVWSAWSTWTVCRKPCGEERRQRFRNCTYDMGRTISTSYCGNSGEESADCNLPKCNNDSDRQKGATTGNSNQAQDIGVTIPLSVIVGTIAAFLIIILLIAVIVLVTRLRRKNRKRKRDVTSGAGTENLARKNEGRNPSVKPKKVVSICEEGSSHFYAEIDDEIIQTRNKSKSIVTLDNPYSELPPKSASPLYKNPDVDNTTYSNIGKEERVFTFGNLPVNTDGSRFTNQKGLQHAGIGSHFMADVGDGGYLTCTPESSQDELDRKPKRYVKQKK